MDALFYLAILFGSSIANAQSGSGNPAPPSRPLPSDGILEGIWNLYDQELAVIGLVYLMATIIVLIYQLLTWRARGAPRCYDCTAIIQGNTKDIEGNSHDLPV